MALIESQESMMRAKGFATMEMDDGSFSWESISGADQGFDSEESAIRDFLEFMDHA